MPADYVIVHLTEENRDGDVTPRRIKLSETSDSIVLGRASSKGVDILAQPDNGYFVNPVVSRNHAEIKADLFYERLYIKDIGSTHGTFVNNIRIPATVRHPIRTGDLVTLGIEIKNHGVDLAHPSRIKVAVQFGMNKPPVEPATNVFQVPDETSVEGSEPEDTLERARRFLHEHTSRREVRDAIDLTEDTDIAMGMAMGAESVLGPAKDEDEDESLEPSLESDLSESDSEENSEDDVQELCELEDELEYDLSPEPSCTGALDEIEANTLMEVEAEAPMESGRANSPRVTEEVEDGTGPSQSAEDISPPLEVEDVTIVESESHPLLSEVGDHVEPTANGDPNLSKKRKASDISVDESEAQGLNDMPAVNVLSAAGVQTDPSDMREPKRLRRAADIVGYTALGGLAGALAVFATLVVSAPSFS